MSGVAWGLPPSASSSSSGGGSGERSPALPLPTPGCILYEMICLKRPFEGNDIRQLVMRILKGTVAPIPKAYRCGCG